MDNDQRVKTKVVQQRPRLRREDSRVGRAARSKYRLIAEKSGHATAHREALEDLFGVISWLNDTTGTRDTYELVQQHADLVADTVVENRLSRPRLRREA